MSVWYEIKRMLFTIAVIYLALQFLWMIAPIGRDSTDGDRRSGMSLRIDALTGCHYLEGSRSGLIPRVAATGEHICTGYEN